jgi:hypothetical protein
MDTDCLRLHSCELQDMSKLGFRSIAPHSWPGLLLFVAAGVPMGKKNIWPTAILLAAYILNWKVKDPEAFLGQQVMSISSGSDRLPPLHPFQTTVQGPST